jgi:hypothetical protein
LVSVPGGDAVAHDFPKDIEASVIFDATEQQGRQREFARGVLDDAS